MMSRAEMYALAADAYEQAKVRVVGDFRQAACNELISFMSGQEWHPALDLLKQSDRHIVLSSSKEVTPCDGNFTREYILTGLGFCEVVHKQGAKPCVREFLKDRIFATNEKQMILVLAFQEYRRNLSLVGFVVGELDKIAGECPKQWEQD